MISFDVRFLPLSEQKPHQTPRFIDGYTHTQREDVFPMDSAYIKEKAGVTAQVSWLRCISFPLSYLCWLNAPCLNLMGRTDGRFSSQGVKPETKVSFPWEGQRTWRMIPGVTESQAAPCSHLHTSRSQTFVWVEITAKACSNIGCLASCSDF